MTIIPKDQQKILSKNGSWKVDLTEREGVPLVPSHVLETVSETFLRTPKQGLEHKTPAKSSQSRPQDGNILQSSSSSNNGNGNNNPPESVVKNSKENQSSPGSTVTSWAASSPPRPSPSAAPSTFESQVIQETPLLGDGTRNHSPRRASQSHSRQVAQNAQATGEEEKDNVDDEEEVALEMALPQAHEESDARVNLEAARLQVASTPALTVTQATESKTPSCAQPHQQVIPDSVTTSKTAILPQQKPEQRPRRRTKPYGIYDHAPRKSESSSTRLPNTWRLPDVESSMSTCSSSVVPGTRATSSTANSHRDPSPGAPLPAKDTLQPNPSAKPPSNNGAISATEPPSNSMRDKPSHQEPVLEPAPTDLFSQFVSTYPDYASTHSGSLKNFVKACLCLEYLQSQRALRPCLYDDFIRLFSGAYLKYVMNAGPGQEPLPAIEWFSMQDAPPVFTKMIITRKNLESALGVYPEEVARARRFIAHEQAGSETLQKKAVATQPSKPIRTSDATDTDASLVQHPKATLAGSANPPVGRLRGPPPELGTEGLDIPKPNPTPSARSTVAPTLPYFERLASRKRPADHLDRFREFLRKRTVSSSLGTVSRG